MWHVRGPKLKPAKESAVPAALKVLQGATTAAPVSVVGQALAGTQLHCKPSSRDFTGTVCLQAVSERCLLHEGADIPLDHKAAIVDAASAETQENQSPGFNQLGSQFLFCL